MSRTTLLPLTAALMLLSGHALAATSSAVADRDTYVKENNKGPYGSEHLISVSKHKKDEEVRVGLVSFSGMPPSSPIDANLTLHVARFDGTAAATVHVYGIRDASRTGNAACGEDFAEGALKYAHLASLDHTESKVAAGSGCIFGGAPLGDLRISRSQLGQTVTFTSPALVSFLQENQTSRVTFLLVRANADKGAGEIGFVAREHMSGLRARLSWTDGSDVGFPDWGVDSTREEDGVVSYVGAIDFPLGGGQTLRLPAADVQMTFTERGTLETIDGTVGYPELPVGGLFDALGALEGTGPGLQIGYGYPEQFNAGAQLPLNPDTRYLYLREVTGASLSWGPLTAEAPGTGETLIVFDLAAPSALFYTSRLPEPVPLTSVQLGVSMRDTIPFRPLTNQGVEGHLTTFDGNLHLGASGEIPTRIPNVVLAVSGDMTAAADPARFPRASWMKHLGGNGEVALAASVGIFSVEIPISESSFRYSSDGEGGRPSLAYASNAALPDLGRLPLALVGKSRVWAYLSDVDNGMRSFVGVKGRVKFGTKWAKHAIDATVVVGPTEALIVGTVTFGGMKMNVRGSANQSHAAFSGSMTSSFGAQGGRVKLKFKAGFDTRKDPIDLSATARFCIAGSCSKVGVKQLEIKSDGHIRVCVDVGVANVCETI